MALRQLIARNTKYALYTRKISNTDLYMRFLVKPCPFVYRITFNKNAAYSVYT